MQLNRVDIREGVADMQMLYRMDVDARLTTQNAGVARSKLIGWRVVDEDRLIVLICQLLAVDVMVDAIGKQRELCRIASCFPASDWYFPIRIAGFPRAHHSMIIR